MTAKERDEFTVRCLMALVTALAVHNYKNARAVAMALAKVHGLGGYAERVLGT
jgi:hypothetical protein